MKRARIPSDVERDDKLLAGLTGRQIAYLAGAALLLWAIYISTRHRLPAVAFGALAAPIAGLSAAFALGRADGLSLDRLARAFLRQRRAPRRLVQAPEGLPAARRERWRSRANPSVARLPGFVRSISPDGIVDVGGDGLRRLCRASAVSFALRSDQEQEALLASFGRFLNGLSAPTEIVVSTRRAELDPLAAAIGESASSLPDPGLEEAAREHARFLSELGETGGFYSGDVLLVLSAPTGAASRDQLARQTEEARSALGGAGVQVVPLSGEETGRLLRSSADPVAPSPPVGSARAGVVRRRP